MPEETESTSPPDHRAGFVALVGLTNVGKSTLLNRLVGSRLSIVTHKAQTTRRRLLGIYSDERHQAVFIDTPGLLEPRYLLQEAMRREATAAIGDADVLVYVVDAGYPASVEAARGFACPPAAPCILCLNKVDRPSPAALARVREAVGDSRWAEVVETVATEGRGIDRLRDSVLARLPTSPPFYPKDELSDAPIRFFAAELVRETCFETLGQEVPYSVAVSVEEFKDRGPDRPLYISALLYVERESQKGIVIGEGGARIREIGRASRLKIESFLERRVFLELRVKVLPNWRKRRQHLKLLGFHSLPPEA